MQSDEQYTSVKDELAAASKVLNTKYNFIFVDNAGNNGALEHFGIKVAETPAFCIHDQSNDNKFVSKNAEPATLTAWLGDYEVIIYHLLPL